MKYVVAGYVIALSVLAIYAVSLLIRRARLEKAAVLAEGRPARETATAISPEDHQL
jgi:hypothetical protein